MTMHNFWIGSKAGGMSHEVFEKIVGNSPDLPLIFSLIFYRSI